MDCKACLSVALAVGACEIVAGGSGVVGAFVFLSVGYVDRARARPGGGGGSARSAANFLALVAEDRCSCTPIIGALFLVPMLCSRWAGCGQGSVFLASLMRACGDTRMLAIGFFRPVVWLGVALAGRTSTPRESVAGNSAVPVGWWLAVVGNRSGRCVAVVIDCAHSLSNPSPSLAGAESKAFSCS